MNEHKLLALIAKEIGKEKTSQVDFLISGRAENHAEYRHVCGVIRGLNTTESFINDLVQRMEQNDD